MTSTGDFDDITLMRYADGELDAETSAAIERAMPEDEALVARIAAFDESRRQAKAAFAPLLDEPVPEALTASVRALIDKQNVNAAPVADAKIIDFPNRAQQPPARRWVLPLAASLAAALLGSFAGYRLAGSPAEDSLSLAGVLGPQLDATLLSIASGEQVALDNGALRAIATFRDAGGSLCREFELDRAGGGTIVSVACRQDGAWRLAFAAAAPAANGGYAPASSLEALDAYLSAIDAQPPLQQEDEKKALAAARDGN